MRVEFFGVCRQHTGASELEIQADTLGQLVSTLASRFPVLSAAQGGSTLHASFTANLNGDRFVSDPKTPLGPDDCVLILSADAGG
jgi:molybdopterin converting factor small subunit